MVPSSLIPRKKLLIEITKQCFTSPWENCIEKLTEEGETLSPGKGIQLAGVGQNPWGCETLPYSCKPPLGQLSFFVLCHELRQHTVFSPYGTLLHFVLMYFHDYVMSVYLLPRDCMLPKDRGLYAVLTLQVSVQHKPVML